jgi:flagellar biosynthesis/type III secretory pathway protein FliH
MTPKERALLLRRGYRAGYHAALRKCRAELDVMAAKFDAEIENLQDEARKELHSLAAGFAAEIGDAIARKVHREKINRVLQEAVDERAMIPDGCLN